MKKLTIGIISAGEMGQAVARVLCENGHSVLTILKGRSDLTKSRAYRSKMQDVPDLETLIARSQYIFSILPPDRASALGYDFADKIKDTVSNTVFVECNAISPQTTKLIADKIEHSGAVMIKVGIIGPPPGSGSITKFYASGPCAQQLNFLDGNLIKLLCVGDDITRASSIKMCYAALTKGMMTLHAGVLVTAELLGVTDEVYSEFQESQQAHWEVMKKRISTYACDSGRWVGEMEEIAQTFGSVGMTSDIHKGAAEVFRILDASPLGVETRRTIDASRSMERSVKIYAETVRKSRF